MVGGFINRDLILDYGSQTPTKACSFWNWRMPPETKTSSTTGAVLEVDETKPIAAVA
jgi:hypothetical protein